MQTYLFHDFRKRISMYLKQPVRTGQVDGHLVAILIFNQIIYQPLPVSWKPALDYILPAAQLSLIWFTINKKKWLRVYVLSLAIMSFFIIYTSVILLCGFSEMPYTALGINITNSTLTWQLFLNTLIFIISLVGLRYS